MRSLITLLLFATVFLSYAQEVGTFEPMTSGYYVVVGVFAVESNARNFSESLLQNGVTVSVRKNERNSWFYVYISKFDNKPSALTSLSQTRALSDFSDAWIKIVLPAEQIDKEMQPEQVVQTTPVEEVAIQEEDIDPIDAYFNEDIVQYDQIDLGNTEVFLSLFNAANNRVVDGTVQVVDTERGKLIRNVKGNDYLILPNPNSKSGTITLIAEVIGYRKIQHELHFNEPLTDTEKPFIELMGTTIFVNFDLTPFSKGEMQTLFNVYFYNDAAVMMPESRFELTNLLNMLKDNPTARIKLHGHTNGNYHGKIIQVGPEMNFFSLSGSKQTSGSANDLAYKRAEVIKNWLISEGIESDRIEIKSWGGKKPLYDKHSANARKNVRVEVEKLAD